jgi:hypothetical protein
VSDALVQARGLRKRFGEFEVPRRHAVELMRGLTTGVVHLGMLGHLSYFLMTITVGALVAAR